MRTKYLSSVLLSILLVTSLMVPLSIVALVSVLPASGQPPGWANHVVISEIYPDAVDETYSEWVELYNPTTDDINIGGLTFGRITTGGSKYVDGTIPAGTEIRAHGYYLIGDNAVLADNTSWPSPDLVVALTITNSNGCYYIENADGYVDRVAWGTNTYGEGSPFPSNPPQGQSLERKPGAENEKGGNGIDTNNNANDFLIRATPDPQNSDNLREPCGVDVDIDPYHLRGVPCDTLTFIVQVHNAGVENDNIILWVEPDGWPMGIGDIWLKDNRFENVEPCEWVSTLLYVHIPDNENLAWPCMHKEIVVVAESETCHARDNDNAMVQVISRFLHSLYPGGQPPPTEPLMTPWHELHPNYCDNYILTSWIDDGNGELSPCDIVDITNMENGDVHWHHVKDVTITMYVWNLVEGRPMYLEFLEGYENYWKKYDPMSLIGTQWHEVWPMFSNLYWFVGWWDQGSGQLDYCDFVYLMDKITGITYECHVENVATDLVLCEKCGVEVRIEPEYKSGEPGENLYYDVIVTNTGTEVCSFDLSYVPNGWPDISIEPSRLENINPFDSDVATLTVHVPENAEPCTEKEIVVIAESDCCDAVDNDNAIAHVLDYQRKENMPDLGQHCINWCWTAAAANSIKWWAEYRGYIELLDDPENAVFPDNNYLQLLPCPWFGVLPRLLHEIAIDCLGLPDNAPIGATWCTPITDNQYYYGLRKFISDQGAPLYVHEIIDNDHFALIGENIPPEDGENVIYDQPTFDNYKRELGRCQDVLLQLDFRNAGYESDPPGTEALDHIVTGVSFYDGGPGNQWIEVADPWTPFPPGPGPDHNNDQTRYTYENLPVLSVDPLVVLYTGENLGVPVVLPVQVVKLIYVSPTAVVENLQLVAGWNLISFPVASDSDTPDNIFAGQTYYIWRWDAENKKYVSPSPTAPVELGVGYWVYVDHDKTVTTSGVPIENFSIDLLAGWNMIGFPVTSPDTTPDNLFAGQTYYIWKWDAIGKTYVSPSATAPVELKVGYWIWVSYDQTIYIPL